MELLERYLQAVGRYLPEGRRRDILAELRANLREEMEAQAEALGRLPGEEEEAEVLRRYGRPVVVAARYGEASPLIGPEMAPFYWFTLRRLTPIVAAVIVLAQAAVWLFQPGALHRIGPEIVHALYSLLIFWGEVTILFAVLDWWRRRSPQTFVSKWDPRELPKVRKEQKTDQPAHPVVDLVVSALFLAWLLTFPHYPVVLLGPAAWMMHGFLLDLAPVWHTFYWMVVGLNTVQIVFGAIALSEVRAGMRRAMKLTERALSLAMLVFLVRAPTYLVPERLAAPGALHGVVVWNDGIRRGLVLLAVIVAIRLAWDVIRTIADRNARGKVHAALL